MPRTLHQMDLSDSQSAAKFVGRNLHRTRRGSRPRSRLRKGRRHRGMKADVALNFLHRLVDVPVENRDGAEAPQVAEGFFAVSSAPAPVRIDGPERKMREYHDGRTFRFRQEVVFEPGKLFPAQLSHSFESG